tara:strand:- start:316 stop:474 length:159 start_codon:yes stop_codon:yes gene_type:complete
MRSFFAMAATAVSINNAMESRRFQKVIGSVISANTSVTLTKLAQYVSSWEAA